MHIASDEEMAAKRTAAEHATRTRHEAQVLKEESLEGEARQHYIKQGKRPCTANNVQSRRLVKSVFSGDKIAQFTVPDF